MAKIFLELQDRLFQSARVLHTARTCTMGLPPLLLDLYAIVKKHAKANVSVRFWFDGDGDDLDLKFFLTNLPPKRQNKQNQHAKSKNSQNKKRKRDSSAGSTDFACHQSTHTHIHNVSYTPLSASSALPPPSPPSYSRNS